MKLCVKIPNFYQGKAQKIAITLCGIFHLCRKRFKKASAIIQLFPLDRYVTKTMYQESTNGILGFIEGLSENEGEKLIVGTL